MSIYSDEFKAVLLKEEQKTNPACTIANISDALCNDRVESDMKLEGAKALEKKLKAKQGS